MPLAEERLAEKTPFDVYAVMLVLSALLTIGAILMFNAELRENWNAAELPGAVNKHSEHLTVLNAQTPEEKAGQGIGESPWVQVTADDKADYKLLNDGQELKTVEYPAWLKVNSTGVKFLEQINDNYPLDQVPADVREKWKSTYNEVDPTAGVSVESKATP